MIDLNLKAFEIKRYLSHKRYPYDKAVEVIFKIIKTLIVRNQTYSSLYYLWIKLADYVNLFNNHRIHSSLGYLTPMKYNICP